MKIGRLLWKIFADPTETTLRLHSLSCSVVLYGFSMPRISRKPIFFRYRGKMAKHHVEVKKAVFVENTQNDEGVSLTATPDSPAAVTSNAGDQQKGLSNSNSEERVPTPNPQRIAGGLTTNPTFLGGLFSKKSFICQAGKSMTPHRGSHCFLLFLPAISVSRRFF